MIHLDDIINVCTNLKDEIGGVDKNDKPIVGRGFNYGVVETCNRIARHFTEVEREKDIDLAIKAEKEEEWKGLNGYNKEYIFHEETVG